MKILTIFETLSTLTSSGAASGYPASNVVDCNPGLVWKADAYSGDVWLKVDFGAAKSLSGVFFNRANFPHAHIQGNASDSWETPSYDLGLDLVKDEAENRKGWFAIVFNYRWLRIVIPASQTLDSGSVPFLGNLIAGTPVDMPNTSMIDIELTGRVDRFETDGGNVTATPRGIQRHLLQIEIRDELATLRSMSKTWTHAVVYEDLSTAGGAWLVTRPGSFRRGTKSTIDASLAMTLEERT